MEGLCHALGVDEESGMVSGDAVANGINVRFEGEHGVSLCHCSKHTFTTDDAPVFAAVSGIVALCVAQTSDPSG